MTKRVLGVTFLLASLPFAAMAASKNSAHVELNNAVSVGNTSIPKGSYKVVWSGTSPNVQVTFTSGKWSTTVPARVTEERSDLEAQTTVAKGDRTLLTGLQLRDAKLTFGDGTQPGE